MDQRAWTECHVAAFEFFGGVPARLVPDNLKTGVDKPDLYDPKVNRSYAELAAHYGCLVDPARAMKPRDKAQGRAADAVCPRQFLARPGVHVAGADAGRGGRWSLEVAGQRALPAAGGRRPCGGVRGGRERDAAAAAGRSRSCWPRGRRRRSARTSTPRSEKVLYSVPWRHIGKTADVRLDRHDGAVLHRRGAGQDPPPQGPREADRLRRLPISYVESRTGQRESPLRSGR